MTEEKPLFSVSELNSYVNLVLSLDGNLKHITVRGEISGFKRHTSGHLYFTLKDEKASVRTVMFKYSANRLTFLPKDGLSVTITGYVGIFEKDGSFQLYAENMISSGSGDLYQRFIALKNELNDKGWFAEGRKKKIPFLPAAVGVVTSASGAAIEDIRRVIGRRFPSMPIVLYPASVQGIAAPSEIASAIKKADNEKAVDVLIVGRGGGSLEDLWAFNELPVATAIYNCTIPVISAVGHEIDFTICDFVSDIRAATPSAAAEIAVPEYKELSCSLNSIADRLYKCIQRGLHEKRALLSLVISSSSFKNPYSFLNDPSQRLESDWTLFNDIIQKRLQDYVLRLKVAGVSLKAYSDESLLAKGFIIAEKNDGSRVFSANDVNEGEELTLHFKNGKAYVYVNQISIIE